MNEDPGQMDLVQMAMDWYLPGGPRKPILTPEQERAVLQYAKDNNLTTIEELLNEENEYRMLTYLAPELPGFRGKRATKNDPIVVIRKSCRRKWQMYFRTINTTGRLRLEKYFALLRNGPPQEVANPAAPAPLDEVALADGDDEDREVEDDSDEETVVVVVEEAEDDPEEQVDDEQLIGGADQDVEEEEEEAVVEEDEDELDAGRDEHQAPEEAAVVETRGSDEPAADKKKSMEEVTAVNKKCYEVLQKLVFNNLLTDISTVKDALGEYDRLIQKCFELLKPTTIEIYSKEKHFHHIYTELDLADVIKTVFVPLRTTPNGNCLYEAISWLLLGEPQLVSLLRLVCVATVLEFAHFFNSEVMRVQISQDHGQCGAISLIRSLVAVGGTGLPECVFFHYHNDIGSDLKDNFFYGSNAAILALSFIVKCRIVIYSGLTEHCFKDAEDVSHARALFDQDVLKKASERRFSHCQMLSASDTYRQKLRLNLSGEHYSPLLISHMSCHEFFIPSTVIVVSIDENAANDGAFDFTAGLDCSPADLEDHMFEKKSSPPRMVWVISSEEEESVLSDGGLPAKKTHPKKKAGGTCNNGSKKSGRHQQRGGKRAASKNSQVNDDATSAAPAILSKLPKPPKQTSEPTVINYVIQIGSSGTSCQMLPRPLLDRKGKA